MTITEFLLARIAEDEADAHAATSVGFDPDWTSRPDLTGQPIMAGKYRIATCGESVMAHIARHDPARALAECEAKRRIVSLDDLDGGQDDGHVHALRCLASVYADHPDFRDEWRV